MALILFDCPQGTRKADMHMAQPPTISSFPASGISGPQSTSILTGIPVISKYSENFDSKGSF